MILKVPFFKQTSPTNCGPTALKMVLAYFGKDESVDVLEARTGIMEGKAVSTIQIATAAASSGYKTDFYSKHLLFNEENMKQKFYQQYGNINVELSKKWLEDAKVAGVNVYEKTLLLEELLKFVTKDSIPIVLVDWNIIMSRKEKGYHGHFVPIVGFNKQNVFIHNHGLGNTKEFMPIPRNIFDKARKAKGTDEDVMIVHGN
jgi:hypothetical protein